MSGIGNNGGMSQDKNKDMKLLEPGQEGGKIRACKNGHVS